ncbi:hypothetical protein D0T21_20520 [Duganella sp. BJB476]|nr:hypothetical protein D0T21_20520 [Duganella sp. BJB476]
MFDIERSITFDRPPIESGNYWVLFDDDSTGELLWDGQKWVTEKTVLRYCGRPMGIDDEEKAQHISNILAGFHVPVGHHERTIAQQSAMRLARSNADRSENAATDSVVRSRRTDACGYYKVAQSLGVSFVSPPVSESAIDGGHIASATDRKVLEAFWQLIAQEKRDSITTIVEGSGPRSNDLREWLVERASD